MQLLYRINRTGTTVLVVTHDREMVDKMRRRVIALDEGRLVRDEAAGGVRRRSRRPSSRCAMRAEMGVGARATPTARSHEWPTMGRVFFFLAEAFRALRRSAAPSIAAIVTIVVTDAAARRPRPGAQTTQPAKTEDVRDQIALKVFLYRRRRPRRDRRRSSDRIAAIPHVDRVEFVSKAEA